MNTEENLEFIRRVITESRESVADNGIIFVVWGAISVVGTGITYLFISQGLSAFIAPFWILISGVGGALSALNAYRSKKKLKIRSRLLSLYNKIWIGLGVGILVIACIFIISRDIPVQIGLAVTAALLGSIYFINSVFNNYIWMRILAVAWWAGSFGILFIEDFFALGLLGVMVFCLELVPGIILVVRKGAKKD